MKQVVDRNQALSIRPDKKDIVRENVNLVENDFDRYAVEEALKLKEKTGGEVVVLTGGGKKAVEAMRKALAMGADRGIYIEGEELALADPWVKSSLFQKAIESESFDLILMGIQSEDMGHAQLGPMLAHRLGVPHVTTVVEIELEGEALLVKRELEGGMLEKVRVNLPSLCTVQTGINKPRYPTLPGIMKAKRKPVKQYKLEELGGEDWQKEKACEVVELFFPPKKEGGRILEGSSEKVVEELVRILREEVKVL